MIMFNKPPFTGNEEKYLLQAMKNLKISGDGEFTERCHRWFEERLGCKKALLTTSCTHALEITAILIGIQPGDEVIMPSYTFVSTANAFVLRGAKIVFVDVRPDTMNIDETLIEGAITQRTKAIVPVHYAGVACEMDTIMDIADRHNLFVIEDAAQGMMSSYKGKPLGTIGHFGTFSFHETKNYTSGGEGGLLIVNDSAYVTQAEITREKGINRSQFFRGMVKRYSWIDIGSNYLMNDLSAAFLWGQLEIAEKINRERRKHWEIYYKGLQELASNGSITLPHVPKMCQHNAHIFYIKTKNLKERIHLIEYLKSHGIHAVFHYVPLHSSPAGIKFGIFHGEDIYTTEESERLVRLPLFYGIEREDIHRVIDHIKAFYHNNVFADREQS